MAKYVVTLTYEASVVVDVEDGSGATWERDAALTAERFASPLMELTDYKAVRCRENDIRPAENE